MQSILCKVYDCDSINDIERDIYEAMDAANISSPEGSFMVNIVHDFDRQTKEDWED